VPKRKPRELPQNMPERRNKSHRLSLKQWLNKQDSKLLKTSRIPDKEQLMLRFRDKRMRNKMPLKLKRLKDLDLKKSMLRMKRRDF
jgi:hypothetical protein